MINHEIVNHYSGAPRPEGPTESRNIAAINRNEAKLLSWVFCGSAPSIAELMKFLQRTNVKEKSREQKLTGTEVARKIAKESRRGLKKGGENDTEQCEFIMP